MDFIFDPSLVLYLPLYELDGASFMSKDAYGHLCTVTGALWTPQGRDFDGIDDKITGATVVSTPSAFTATAWFKRLGDSGGATDDSFHALLYEINGYTWNRIRVSKAGDNLMVSAQVATGLKETQQAISNPEDFHMVGSIWDGANLYPSVDGVLGTPKAAPGTLSSGADGILLGLQTNLIYVTNGIIGEVLVYNRALSLSEVQRNYNATKWRYR